MRDADVCAHCGATDTTLGHFPALMAWFCVAPDGATCHARKVARLAAEDPS